MLVLREAQLHSDLVVRLKKAGEANGLSLTQAAVDAIRVYVEAFETDPDCIQLSSLRPQRRRD